MSNWMTRRFVALASIAGVTTAILAEPASKAPNFGSVSRTRHNLTQSFLPNGGAGWMSLSRNDYGEVCVYCHTPHSANGNVGLPLWTVCPTCHSK